MSLISKNPQPLQLGDTVMVVSPSGALREIDGFNHSLEIWRSRGYHVEFSSHWDSTYHYLAGDDQQRRQSLQLAWQDPQVKAILCSRGGYGSMRLLEDHQWGRQAPLKWLIGFSDATALLWSLQKNGIAGIHGPVMTTLSQEPSWSCQRMFNLLEGKEVEPLLGTGWGRGISRGRLLAGNLTVATALLGTCLQPDLEGIILALEDVGESPYRIDRMLTQWRLSGLLQKVKAIALGRFSNCHRGQGDLEQVLKDRLLDLSIPIVSDLPFGHDGPNAALKLGAMAELDGDKGVLHLLN